MAHFAQIDENNQVQQVIVVSNDDCGNLEFPESEAVGQAFLASLGLPGVWKQTSYNSNFRQRYAGIGSVYLADPGMFTSIKLYPSWILNTEYEWEAPVAKPIEDGFWAWDETEQVWKR